MGLSYRAIHTHIAHTCDSILSFPFSMHSISITSGVSNLFFIDFAYILLVENSQNDQTANSESNSYSIFVKRLVKTARKVAEPLWHALGRKRTRLSDRHCDSHLGADNY